VISSLETISPLIYEEIKNLEVPNWDIKFLYFPFKTDHSITPKLTTLIFNSLIELASENKLPPFENSYKQKYYEIKKLHNSPPTPTEFFPLGLS
jgi:hypothetical protein